MIVIRNCPECNCEIVYKKKRSYDAAESNNAACKRCNFQKLAKDPVRNQKVSEAKKKWWEEKKKNQEEYSTLCEKMGKNNSAIWLDELRKLAWISSRWCEEKKAEMSDKVREKWEKIGNEEFSEIKKRMVAVRVENGSIGRNNKKKRGTFEGVEYESSTEERFLKSYLLSLKLQNALAITSADLTYKPDFWSEKLQCYIEVKSSWTFDVMRGLRQYNSRNEYSHNQLEKIVLLCSKSNIKICVEIDRSFYIIDPVSVTKLTNVVKDGKLLSFSLNDNIKI